MKIAYVFADSGHNVSYKNRERLAELQAGAPARQARMARAMRAAVEAVRSAHPPTAAHMTVQRSRRSP